MMVAVEDREGAVRLRAPLPSSSLAKDVAPSH